MKKRILGICILAVISLLWMNGCSAEEKKEAAGTAQKPVESSLEEEADAASVSKGKVESPDGLSEEEARYLKAPLSEMQQKLGVTEESRREFVEKYGLEEYEMALNSVPYFIFSCTNEKSPVLETDTKMYRDDSEIETISITSSMEDAHEIPADYVTDGNKEKDTVILVHGATENRRKLFWRTRMFLDMGYNVLQYDQRSSGDNKAPYVTYGVFEQYDLYDCVQYVSEHNGNHKIGVFGSSMGGLTVLKLLSNPDEAQGVDFGIVDCPLVRAQDVIERRIEENCPEKYKERLPKAMDDFLSFFIGFTLEEADGYLFADKIQTPLLMFASKKDEILSCEQQKEFFDKVGSKEKYLFVSETASHCCVAADDEEEYARLTREMLEGRLFDSVKSR